MKLTSKQQHTKDIITGCGVPSKYGFPCGCPVVGRVVHKEWRHPVCERHAESMVANGFRVKLYKTRSK